MKDYIKTFKMNNVKQNIYIPIEEYNERGLQVINQMLSALAESNRFNIIETLKNGNHTVNEIAEILQIRQPQVSKHLKVLNEAGLVTVNPIKQKHVYSLAIEPFENLQEWTISIRETWNNRLDRLEEYMEEYVEKQTQKEQQDESETRK